MNKELDNLKFSTKSIMLTDRQRDTISDLIDQLSDMGIDDYNNIEYWKMSKLDASKLISNLINEIENIDDYYFYDNYDYDIYNCGDR